MSVVLFGAYVLLLHTTLNLFVATGETRFLVPLATVALGLPIAAVATWVSEA